MTVKTGCVYFIDTIDGLYVKIGFSYNVRKRLRSLQGGSPKLLELRGWVPGNRTSERKLHKMFATDRFSGEWFIRTDRMDEFESVAFTIQTVSKCRQPGGWRRA